MKRYTGISREAVGEYGSGRQRFESSHDARDMGVAEKAD